jgi:DNA modification methylase
VVAVAKQPTAAAAAEPDQPNRTSQADNTYEGRDRGYDGRHRAEDPTAERLSVWATAQATGPVQRRGRYVPESVKHPARMLPAIAAHAVDAYTSPGDLVLDPMCGIGTTL